MEEIDPRVPRAPSCAVKKIQFNGDSKGVKNKYNKFLIDSLHSSELGLVSPRLDGRSQGIWLKAAHGVLTHVGTLKPYICRAKLTSWGEHLRCDIWKEFWVLKMGDPQVTMIVSI
jgi:hypothetical protein